MGCMQIGHLITELEQPLQTTKCIQGKITVLLLFERHMQHASIRFLSYFTLASVSMHLDSILSNYYFV